MPKTLNLKENLVIIEMVVEDHSFDYLSNPKYCGLISNMIILNINTY